MIKKIVRYLIAAAAGIPCLVVSSNAAGVMREMTSMQIVEDMKLGWNLGNTLDAWADGVSGLSTETCWGNPKTTKAMFDALKAKGFKTVRVPVTWNGHFGGSPSYTIDKAWLDRVEEVVKYGIDNGMYVILNTHHDEWVKLYASSQTEVTSKITKLWEQISARFKDYSDYLIFETLNEPRLYGESSEWNGGTADARKVLNAYNLAIVNTIRSSGGNNALRHIMIPTHAATSMDVAQNDLVIPNNDKKVIVSQHTYWPYTFTMENPGSNTWGTASDKTACDTELDRIYNKFCKKGIAVVVGEWGTIDKSNTSARTVHAEYYTAAVRKRGMLPVWWDNGDSKTGGFALLNRNAGTWYFPDIVNALIKGSNVAVTVDKDAVSLQTAKNNPVLIESGIVKLKQNLDGAVAINVMDLKGRAVCSVVNARVTKGEHIFKIPTERMSRGSYVINVETAAGAVAKKFNNY
jgi:endoglucanase